jgi:hypothetical protein
VGSTISGKSISAICLNRQCLEIPLNLSYIFIFRKAACCKDKNNKEISLNSFRGIFYKKNKANPGKDFSKKIFWT